MNPTHISNKYLDIAMEKVIKQEVNAVLDKISAEIEKEYNKYRNMSEKWDERACGIGTTLEIIDKY